LPVTHTLAAGLATTISTLMQGWRNKAGYEYPLNA